LARVVGAGLTARGAAQSWRWQAPKRPRTQSAAPSLGRPGVAKDDRCTVYVKNLPYGAEEADVVAHFEQAGRVADVRRGVAADGAPSARPAVACSDPYPDPLPALGAPGGRPARRHELWPPLQSGCWRVCTADRRARELPRRMHWALSRARRRAGKLHGFGFVQFDSAAGAEAALRLHGSSLMGRELTVDAASADTSGPGAPVTGEPVEGCWFCLSNPNADVNLVASIGAPRRPCVAVCALR